MTQFLLYSIAEDGNIFLLNAKDDIVSSDQRAFVSIHDGMTLYHERLKGELPKYCLVGENACNDGIL